MAVFSVIISEKGGAERRETFDRNEINVGRVQGNELVLPKGNVSKRHARLLHRDGRFIVTDLKSTNGTYVNGRKIAQATIVREGDKIYIGDFVLRIEAGAGAAHSIGHSSDEHAPLLNPSSSMPPDAAGPSQPPLAPPPLAPPPLPAAHPVTSASLPPAAHVLGGPPPLPEAARRVTEAPAFAPPTPFAPGVAPQVAYAPVEAKPPSPVPGDPPSSSQPSSVEKGLRAPAPRIEPKTGDRHEVISHFPLENDPDESVHVAVPAPPRVPSQPQPRPLAGIGGKTLPVPQGPLPTGATRTAPPAPVVVQPSVPQTGALDRPTSPSVGLAPLSGMGAPAIPPPRRPMPSSPSELEAPPPRRPMPSSPSELEAPRPALPRTGPSASQVPATMSSGYIPAPPPPGFAPSAIAGRAFGSAEPSVDRAPVDAARGIAQRAAIVTLLDRVAELCDLRPLADGAPPDEALTERVERALADAAGAMRGQGDIDLDALLVEARRELLEHGPLTVLFDDEDVTEIQVVRHDYVVAMHGRRQVPSEIGFSSEAAVGRAIRRLCVAAGRPLQPGEVFVERRLPRGGRLFAVLPRAEDSGHMVVIRKPQRADLTLEDLVRSGTISRAMAGLFTQCVAARANILVTGAEGAGATTLLGALAAAGSTDDRVVVLQEDDELIFNQPHTISILLGDTPEEGGRAVQAAARVRADRLVVGAFAGPVAAELVDVMGDGVDGVLAGARAPTLRQAVLRLTADIAATRPGLMPEVAREWLASVFDLAIEIARLRDGRHRVLRVSELCIEGNRIALRDIFNFNVERTAAGGAIEGTFAPTGTVPGIIEDLAARGFAVDPSIFRRHGKNDSIVSTPNR
ncbi:Type II/IV secretion system ATP hydrolase TadA/VirB11/CpaF, TadA subfamily protein [Minicystis rosea]|nr:Type II/IV secretion system ATP hydrolase TadA/VirB11/CpaF, TadA subfamily protein [Minicystis rosea]